MPATAGIVAGAYLDGALNVASLVGGDKVPTLRAAASFSRHSSTVRPMLVASRTHRSIAARPCADRDGVARVVLRSARGWLVG